MAIENEELQQAMEELRRAFGGLADAADGSADGVRKLTEAEKKLKKQIDLTMQGLGGIAKFGSAVGKGETDLKAFNGIVDTATGLMGGMAKAIPVFGDALADVAKGLGEAAKMAVDALDNTAKSFVEIGKVGGLTAKGMSGVREQFIRSGLSLQSFQKQVVENSQTLAKFRGLTGEGANEFASIVGNLTQGTDDSLRRMGFNAEEMAQSTGAFLTQQTRLGRSQQMTQQQLTAGTIQYAQELDELTKVTGLSRDAIQKQQDAALSESRFRANYETLMSQGREKEAKALMAFQSQMQAIGPELGQGARDLASGAANTDAARKLLASTGGAAQDIIAQITAGNIDQYEAAKQLQAASRQQGDAARENARFVDRANSAFVDFAQQADLNNAQLVEGRGLVKKVQNEQAKGGDQLTDSTVSAQKNLEKMSQELNKLGFTLLPHAAVVVEKFTSVMTSAIAGVNKALGISGGAAGTAPTSAKDANRQAQASAKAGGAGFFGQQWAGIKAGAAHTFGIGGETPSGGPPSINSMDYIKFTGGTGSEEHFKKLQPNVQSAFLQMAQEYNNLTGKKLQVNSAFRSPEEQANVDSGTNPKAAPGMSLHQLGRALDIQSDQVADLASKGLLGKFGFNTLSGDPPHISMATGGVLSGPSSGYRPNLTMHGTEAVVPLPDGRSIPVSNNESGIMSQQLAKLEELVSVMKTQVSISSKLLSYSS
jgi:hypothetical protein